MLKRIDDQQLSFLPLEPAEPSPRVVGTEKITTEGIKYSGSKRALLPKILEVIGSLNVEHVLDGFSGSTRVSQALAKSGYKVTANDCSVWSGVLNTCYLKGENTGELRDKLQYLNTLPGRDGWFTEHYGGYDYQGSAVQPDGKKRPWQVHNTRKLDAIRPEIDRIAESEVEKSVLLTSLILALDRVDSTLGHYCSYLRDWSPRSYGTMVLNMPKMVCRNREAHSVITGDIFDVLDEVVPDLAYLDPPYGSNNEKMPPSRVRYASYYHIWTTICLDDQPHLVGAANRRSDAGDRVASSVFEEFRKDEEGNFIAVNAIQQAIQKCRSRYVLLSYSSGGRATKEQLLSIMSEAGRKTSVFAIDHRRNVMANMRWTNDWSRDVSAEHSEYLFLIER